MNGIGGGGGGTAYQSEDDYDDNMHGNGGVGVAGNMPSPGGGMVGIGSNLSKLSSILPNYVNNNNLSGMPIGGGPLSSLHGMTNQPQLVPNPHHNPSGIIPSSYMSTSIGSNLNNTMHSTNSSISNTPSNTGGGGGGRSQNNSCCLIDDGRKCNRSAGNASYNKRVQKTVLHKRLRLETDPNVQHIYICDYHKMIIQNARTRQKKESDEDINDGNPDDVPEVDLYQLQVNTLRRYKKHYKISSRPGLNKAQLADILMRHFKTIPVQEKEIVTYFIYMVKAERNKLDNNRPDPLQSTASTQGAMDYQSVRF